MNLHIDNFDGNGPRDYSSAIESNGLPQVVRRLNQPAELRVSLVADKPDFVVPVTGARVTLGRMNGKDVFTGYLSEPPAFEYLGWGEAGPVYRYSLLALSDESALDDKRLPDRAPFVARSAGDALRQLTQDLSPARLETADVQDLDLVPYYSPDPTKPWSANAAELALRARASYRAMSGKLEFAPVGTSSYALEEDSISFSPDNLKLKATDGVINDITVTGLSEPQDYVKDYFVGDGLTLRFNLSQTPFTRSNRTIVDEEYKGTTLDPTRWLVADPTSAVSVSGGKLQVTGGTGADGQTNVRFTENIELGGAFILQHGDVSLTAPSDGIVGGLYVDAVGLSACVVGFRITPSGSASNVQAIVNGLPSGPSLLTTAGHRYVFTTRFYAQEIYREQQVFHSTVHPAGNPRGGGQIAANVRMVLEVHDINPADPASFVAPSIVLYDGVLDNAPGFCSYALVNSIGLHGNIAFTRLTQAIDVEVRSALPAGSFRTRLAGTITDGAECLITTGPALQFFPQSVPARGELIEVRYRGRGSSVARVTNPTSIAALARDQDDGIRAAVRHVRAPAPRTASDCETAALTLLDDANGPAWSGEYKVWSDFLPADDVFPGDELRVAVPSQAADFSATLREVRVEVRDLDGEHSLYTLRFADDAALPLAFDFETTPTRSALNAVPTPNTQVGSNFLESLTEASASPLPTSTTVDIDAGGSPPTRGGIEVRRTDAGWGPDNDRNLVGRFTTRTFTVPRLSRVQDYYLRQFDDSNPPRYSRYSAALHVDYPL